MIPAAPQQLTVCCHQS